MKLKFWTRVKEERAVLSINYKEKKHHRQVVNRKIARRHMGICTTPDPNKGAFDKTIIYNMLEQQKNNKVGANYSLFQDRIYEKPSINVRKVNSEPTRNIPLPLPSTQNTEKMYPIPMYNTDRPSKIRSLVPPQEIKNVIFVEKQFPNNVGGEEHYKLPRDCRYESVKRKHYI